MTEAGPATHFGYWVDAVPENEIEKFFEVVKENIWGILKRRFSSGNLNPFAFAFAEAIAETGFVIRSNESEQGDIFLDLNVLQHDPDLTVDFLKLMVRIDAGISTHIFFLGSGQAYVSSSFSDWFAELFDCVPVVADWLRDVLLAAGCSLEPIKRNI